MGLTFNAGMYFLGSAASKVFMAVTIAAQLVGCLNLLRLAPINRSSVGWSRYYLSYLPQYYDGATLSSARGLSMLFSGLRDLLSLVQSSYALRECFSGHPALA